MSEQNVTYLTDVALITCVVPLDESEEIIKAGMMAGAVGILSHHGRGVGSRERLGLLGICVEAEKDVISMLVPSDQSEIIANHIHKAGQFDTPGHGFLTITPLEKMATFVPESMLNRMREPG